MLSKLFAKAILCASNKSNVFPDSVGIAVVIIFSSPVASSMTRVSPRRRLRSRPAVELPCDAEDASVGWSSSSCSSSSHVLAAYYSHLEYSSEPQRPLPVVPDRFPRYRHLRNRHPGFNALVRGCDLMFSPISGAKSTTWPSCT